MKTQSVLLWFLVAAAYAAEPKFDEPFLFEGEFHTSGFDNCCFYGESIKSKYDYIKLDRSFVIAADFNEESDRYSFHEVQIAHKEGVSNKIAEGTPIKLYCQKLFEGFTGHYALHVYCENPVIKVMKKRAGTIRGKNGNIWKKNEKSGKWEDTGVKAKS